MKTILRTVVALAAFALVTPAFAQAFPVTIKHGLGETTIPAEPKRVVTLGWSSTDAAIALGTVPVGVPSFRSEGYDKDLVPWVEQAIAEAGAETPVAFDDTSGAPIEKIAALKPDLILAVYSGVSADEYKLLNQIAPVVAFPTTPWTASWQEVITVTGEALGKPDEAKVLVAELEQFVRDEAAKYPELADASAVTLLDYNDALAIHSADDARAKMLALAGLTIPPKPGAAGPNEGFWYPLSYENADQIPADVLIPFFSNRTAADEFYAKPFIAAIPQIRKGAYVRMDDRIANMAVISSSALSIRWAMPDYLKLIAEAVRNAKK
ncbi:iron-siderophore ABC transporter substrate-binding protein [Devosia sp. CN2-171]|uniref:iron-siderophore ABC transporter substrate-binding protein n=1 Tax=Devosia sp. CN2-171 TaxID=3400909 RepID=UPI003BF7BBEE